MSYFKRVLRLLGLALLMSLAALGIGAPVNFNTREKFMDHQVTIELKEEREDEESALEEVEKK